MRVDAHAFFALERFARGCIAWACDIEARASDSNRGFCCAGEVHEATPLRDHAIGRITKAKSNEVVAGRKIPEVRDASRRVEGGRAQRHGDGRGENFGAVVRSTKYFDFDSSKLRDRNDRREQANTQPVRFVRA